MTTIRLDLLEKRVWRMEKIIWYIAVIISAKIGVEAIPIVTAALPW